MFKTGLIQVATEFFTGVDPGLPNLFLFYQQFSVNVKYRKFLETPISIIIFFLINNSRKHLHDLNNQIKIRSFDHAIT